MQRENSASWTACYGNWLQHLNKTQFQKLKSVLELDVSRLVHLLIIDKRIDHDDAALQIWRLSNRTFEFNFNRIIIRVLFDALYELIEENCPDESSSSWTWTPYLNKTWPHLSTTGAPADAVESISVAQTISAKFKSYLTISSIHFVLIYSSNKICNKHFV